MKFIWIYPDFQLVRMLLSVPTVGHIECCRLLFAHVLGFKEL